MSASAALAEVKVVASFKPVHSLVAAVMDGVGTPGIIIEGAGSPHSFAMKPSQAQMLEEADVVFWIGHELEAFLEKPLETIAAGATSVELIDADNLAKLDFRDGGPFEKHMHGEEAGHDDHAETAEADHGHDDGDEHARGSFDAHVWLDPINAKAMVQAIEEALVAADPENAAAYKANAKATMVRLNALVAEVSSELEPVKGKALIVFHDAYHYFESRFGMTAAGSITVSPESQPGAERITEIRKRVMALGAICVFAEPQFEPKLVSTVIEGTASRAGVIDPLGSDVENGPDLYFTVIRNMAAAIKDCLSEAS